MTPDVQPLPYRQRRYLFSFLFLIFVFVLPLFVFYATGYRFDFTNDESSIVGVGGMYISADSTDVEMFIDEKPVQDIRVFRSASYIQNLESGLHELHVQKEGLQTWTKRLPVFPHIVTEAQAFNMPLVPQVRLITPWLTSTGDAVVFVATTTEQILPFASTTNTVRATTSSATTTYQRNSEYEYVLSLFSTSTATTTDSTLVGSVVNGVEQAFNFSSTLGSSTEESPTTTVTSRDVMLVEQQGEVYAVWTGSNSARPYYYCIDYTSASSTRALYGEHVYESIASIIASTSDSRVFSQNDRVSVCRDRIRIDRKRQTIHAFDFFPGSTDLALLVLDDGLYAVEIDDRAWQNTQLLFPGENLSMRIDGGRIYVFDGERYMEVLTQLPG